MFKVGDLVTRLPGAPYTITNDGSVCKVVSIYTDGYMVVQVISSVNPGLQEYVGSTYQVEVKHFRLDNEVKQDRFEFHKKRVEERHLEGFAN